MKSSAEEATSVAFLGKSKTLNQGEKHKVTATLVSKAFEKAINTIEAKGISWANAVYDKFILPYLAHMEALPNYMMTRKSALRIDLYGENLNFIQEDYKSYALGRERLQIKTNCDMTPLIGPNTAYTDFFKEAEQITQEWDRLQEKRQGVNAEITAAINACNTTKRLFENWPEAYQIYCELYPERATQKYLPAICRGHLNSVLGIKPVTVAA